MIVISLIVIDIIKFIVKAFKSLSEKIKHFFHRDIKSVNIEVPVSKYNFTPGNYGSIIRSTKTLSIFWIKKNEEFEVIFLGNKKRRFRFIISNNNKSCICLCCPYKDSKQFICGYNNMTRCNLCHILCRYENKFLKNFFKDIDRSLIWSKEIKLPHQ